MLAINLLLLPPIRAYLFPAMLRNDERTHVKRVRLFGSGEVRFQFLLRLFATNF
jgi:hypothetical protein